LVVIGLVVIHLQQDHPLTQKCHYLQVTVTITQQVATFGQALRRMNQYQLNLHHLMVLTIAIIVVTVVAIISVINVML